VLVQSTQGSFSVLLPATAQSPAPPVMHRDSYIRRPNMVFASSLTEGRLRSSLPPTQINVDQRLGEQRRVCRDEQMSAYICLRPPAPCSRCHFTCTTAEAARARVRPLLRSHCHAAAALGTELELRTAPSQQLAIRALIPLAATELMRVKSPPNEASASPRALPLQSPARWSPSHQPSPSKSGGPSAASGAANSSTSR
jgi:hypothetical protein